MKPLLIGLALLLSKSALALPVEYKTLHLISWTYQCSQRLAPTFQMKGMALNLAMQSAIRLCSCVIDHYRENHRYVDLQLMPLPQRKAFGEMYSRECINYPERET